MLRRARAVILCLGLLGAATAAVAVEPDEVLDDPRLERRAREISQELRCLVCQNQSIDDSNAPLAKDLRVLVRKRLKAGDSNDQVIDYVVARYGEFVLLRPRVAWHTLVLWFGPPLLFILAVAVMYRSYQRRKAEKDEGSQAALTGAEKRRLKKLLRDR